MDWSVGDFFWTMLIFFYWFAVIWMFIIVIGDILRRDMSGWAKAAWILLIVVLPFLGTLTYLIARPKDERRAASAWSLNPQPTSRQSGVANEIATAAQLYDQGRITSDEYEDIKQRALA